MLFQVLLYPQVNVQEQSHISAESNPSLPPSLVPCQGSEEPRREEAALVRAARRDTGSNPRGHTA